MLKFIIDLNVCEYLFVVVVVAVIGFVDGVQAQQMYIERFGFRDQINRSMKCAVQFFVLYYAGGNIKPTIKECARFISF